MSADFIGHLMTNEELCKVAEFARGAIGGHIGYDEAAQKVGSREIIRQLKAFAKAMRDDPDLIHKGDQFLLLGEEGKGQIRIPVKRAKKLTHFYHRWAAVLNHLYSKLQHKFLLIQHVTVESRMGQAFTEMVKGKGFTARHLLERVSEDNPFFADAEHIRLKTLKGSGGFSAVYDFPKGLGLEDYVLKVTNLNSQTIYKQTHATYRAMELSTALEHSQELRLIPANTRMPDLEEVGQDIAQIVNEKGEVVATIQKRIAGSTIHSTYAGELNALSQALGKDKENIVRWAKLLKAHPEFHTLSIDEVWAQLTREDQAFLNRLISPSGETVDVAQGKAKLAELINLTATVQRPYMDYLRSLLGVEQTEYNRLVKTGQTLGKRGLGTDIRTHANNILFDPGAHKFGWVDVAPLTESDTQEQFEVRNLEALLLGKASEGSFTGETPLLHEILPQNPEMTALVEYLQGKIDAAKQATGIRS